MDPFEVRLQFVSLLSRLDASTSSAQKAALFAIRNGAPKEDKYLSNKKRKINNNSSHGRYDKNNENDRMEIDNEVNRKGDKNDIGDKNTDGINNDLDFSSNSLGEDLWSCVVETFISSNSLHAKINLFFFVETLMGMSNFYSLMAARDIREIIDYVVPPVSRSIENDQVSNNNSNTLDDIKSEISKQKFNVNGNANTLTTGLANVGPAKRVLESVYRMDKITKDKYDECLKIIEEREKEALIISAELLKNVPVDEQDGLTILNNENNITNNSDNNDTHNNSITEKNDTSGGNSVKDVRNSGNINRSAEGHNRKTNESNGSGGFWDCAPNEILRRMEQDRERNKRLKEQSWLVSVGGEDLDVSFNRLWEDDDIAELLPGDFEYMAEQARMYDLST